MQLKLNVFLLQFTIFYYQCNIVKSMTGNVYDTEYGQFPMVASVIRVDNNADMNMNHQCTGTLLSTYDLVSVAHCFEERLMREVRIVAGAHDLRDPRAVRYRVYWWLTFNEWSHIMEEPLEYQLNDAVFVKLSRRVPRTLLPAAITRLTNVQLSERRVRVVGWSRNATGILNPLQLRAKLNILSKTDCDRGLTQLSGGVPVDTDNTIICTFSNPAVIFQEGDNGSPLLLQNHVLVGITIGTCQNPATSGLSINMHVSVDYYRAFFEHLLLNTAT